MSEKYDLEALASRVGILYGRFRALRGLVTDVPLSGLPVLTFPKLEHHDAKK